MSRIAERLQPEDYGGLPGFKEPTTSRDAALLMAGDAKALREQVFAEIAAAGERGLTPDEAAKRLGRTVLAVRPRVSELAKGGRIVATGERRANESGLKAKAWRTPCPPPR